MRRLVRAAVQQAMMRNLVARLGGVHRHLEQAPSLELKDSLDDLLAAFERYATKAQAHRRTLTNSYEEMQEVVDLIEQEWEKEIDAIREDLETLEKAVTY